LNWYAVLELEPSAIEYPLVIATFGGAAAATVIVNVATTVFPAASVAVQVTVVVPFAKNDPELGVQETLATPTLSVAVGAAYVTVAPVALVAWTSMFAGTVIFGASRS
jgi:hypothetical protein